MSTKLSRTQVRTSRPRRSLPAMVLGTRAAKPIGRPRASPMRSIPIRICRIMSVISAMPACSAPRLK